MIATLTSFGSAASSVDSSPLAAGSGDFLFRLRLTLRHEADHVLQQLSEAVAVLSRDRKEILNAEAAKLLGVRLKLRRIHLVDGEENRLP